MQFYNDLYRIIHLIDQQRMDVYHQVLENLLKFNLIFQKMMMHKISLFTYKML